MQNNRTLSEELKFQYRFGGMHVKLIFVNTIVFFSIKLLDLIGKITDQGVLFETIKVRVFALQTNLSDLLIAPYGFITNIFAHFSFVHFLMNMVFLYLSGNIFRQFFSDRRLLHVYIVGGIAGGVAEVIVQQFVGVYPLVIGASRSINGRVYRHCSLQAEFAGHVLWDSPCEIVHSGTDLRGSGFGTDDPDRWSSPFCTFGWSTHCFLSVQSLHASSNIINWTESVHQRILGAFSGKKRAPKMKVQKGERVVKSDEQYNMDTKARQERIDKILDKISKSGYESLTKAEKDFLFSQSNK